MAKKEQKPRKWLFAIFVILFLMFIGFILVGFISLFIGFDVSAIEGNVAVIPVKGVILVEKGAFAFGQEVASSAEIAEFIEKADKNPKIKAIIFDINSPGGSAVASDEIANAIKKTNKTTVAVIREVGASGGYWVASACDYVIANRMSITGSIGVIASYLQFSGLLNDYNVTYERLVAGKYKDLGSPYKELTFDERRLFEKKLDLIHDYFVEEVAENRKLSKKDVSGMAEGEFYLGSEAKELGLVDILGNKDDAVKLIEDKLNITVELAEYKKSKTLRDILTEAFNEKSFFVGRGIGSAMLDKKVNEISIIT